MPATISLDGPWNVVFDPADDGVSRGYPSGLPRGHSVPVPGVWELARPGYDGAGWYERTFSLERAADGDTVRLRFGAVNYACQAWVNGTRVGDHEGGYTPFVLDVTAAVRPGLNRLVLRVVDPPRDRAVDGFLSSAPLRQTDIPVWKAGWYHNFGGVWQSVDLLLRGAAYVDDTFVQASCLRKKLRVACRLVNTSAPRVVELHMAARPHRGGGAPLFEARRTVRLESGARTIRLDRALDAFTAWDCDRPFLYDLKVTLAEDGRLLDEQTVRFGIRDIDIERGHLRLNGKRIMLKGFLQQGVYPVTLAFPHNRAMARREMRLLKDHGFNYIRAHLKPSPPEILDLADELGLLIGAEPPMGWIRPTPAAAARAEREVRELVLRDRNRPSVAFWCLFNELPDAATRALKRRRLMQIARRLDPTRLVIGNAGAWGANGHTECLLPYSRRLDAMIVEGAYYGSTQSGLTRFREEGTPGVAALISEFSAKETLMPYRRVLARYTPAQRRAGLEDYAQYQRYHASLKSIFRQAGLRRIWADETALHDEVDAMRAEEARLEVSNIRVNPCWQGYAFCQLADASGEIFGATDLWRRPKRVFEQIAEASRTPWITPFVDPRSVRPGEPITCRAWWIHEGRPAREVRIVATITSAAGRTVHRVERRVTVRGWSQPVWNATVKAPMTPGPYVLRAAADAGGERLCENTMTFTVLPEPAPRTRDLALFDLTGRLQAPLEARGYRVRPAGNNERRKDLVAVFAMEPDSHPVLVQECLGAARRIVEAGGVLVLLEQDWPLFWWYLVPHPIRQQPMMRHIITMHDHPVFEGLPGKGIMSYDYTPVAPRRMSLAHDVLANGGEVISGALSAHMWTDPDVYHWGSCLDVIPLGRGHVLSCAFPLLRTEAPIAHNLLANLIDHAHRLIRPGGEEQLEGGRCIERPGIGGRLRATITVDD